MEEGASRSVYYLPGHGGQIATGLGEGLLSRGWSVTGRETIGAFQALPFQHQIDRIAEDLSTRFWQEDAQVVAVSYGAYLFLHAQAQLAPFIGRVLLLSPIVGSFSHAQIRRGFIPPRASKLRQLALEGRYPAPLQCQIHVGAEDWQSHPTHVAEFATSAGIPVTVVPHAGHRLGKQYVGSLLDQWLEMARQSGADEGGVVC